MDPHDPNDEDDRAELDAALEGLRAYRPANADADPATAALVQRADFQEGIEIRRRLAQMEPPAAPEAVEIAAEGGAVLVQAEAVSTYVAPVEVALPEAPRLPSAPVKILDEVDPRRKPTVRIARKVGAHAPNANAQPPNEREPVAARSPWAKDGDEKAAMAIERAMLPSATAPAAAESAARAGVTRASAARPNAVAPIEAPSSGAVAEPGWRRRLLVGATIFVAGGIAVLAVIRPPERTPDTTTATPTQAAPPVAVSAVATGAGRVETPTASMDARSTPPAASAASSTSAVSAPTVTASSAPSAAVTPRTSGDPYADASAPVVKSVPAAGPSVAPAVSGAPVASTSPHAAPPVSAPSSKPAASGVPSSTPFLFPKDK